MYPMVIINIPLMYIIIVIMQAELYVYELYIVYVCFVCICIGLACTCESIQSYII